MPTSPDDHPRPELPIEVIAVSDAVVSVIVRGEVDLMEAGELRAVLADACSGTHQTVIVDLSDVGFIGSSGMGVLAQRSHGLSTAGRAMLIRGCHPRVRRAFEVTGLDQVLDIT